MKLNNAPKSTGVSPGIMGFHDHAGDEEQNENEDGDVEEKEEEDVERRGGIDAEDPGCWDDEGVANGFINDESRALFVAPEPEDTGDFPDTPDDTASSGLDSDGASADAEDSDL